MISVHALGQITPWNVSNRFCADHRQHIVLKSSELTPLSALLICTLIEEAGFPPGVIIVNGYSSTPGQTISEHPLIEK
ncbi:hypothetical protein BDR07DRAFT_400064 [Suillus spraguei]|nr:hypothetical protein BDR07DRAFT_400064 [Suillus spraguei]